MRFQRLKHDLPKRSLAFEMTVAALLVVLWWYGAQLPRPKKIPGIFDRWRETVVARVEAVFDPPSSAWVAGVLLGADDGFSQAWKDAFKRTGTSHLTAVSGANVSVVIASVQAALLRMPIGRRMRGLLALAFVTGFVLLTGSPGSVIRAVVMIFAIEAGRHLGRPVKPLRALLLAGLAISLVSPRSLAADRGFQLSILAAFGLAAIAPALEASMPKRLPAALADWISQTLAASVATAPLIALMSGNYSLVSLPANVAVAAFMSPIMAGGAFLLALSLVSIPLAHALFLLSKGLFMLPLATIRAMGSWRIASVSGPVAYLVLVAVEVTSIIVLLRWRRRASLRYAVDE